MDEHRARYVGFIAEDGRPQRNDQAVEGSLIADYVNPFDPGPVPAPADRGPNNLTNDWRHP